MQQFPAETNDRRRRGADGRGGRDLMHRWEGNPIITVEDLPFQCSDICNAGAVKLPNRYLLLLTIESLAGRKAIFRAWSGDGYHFMVEPHPFLEPATEGFFAACESQGVLDPRIVRLEGVYYLTYQALSGHGYVMGVARTDDDFQTVERVGIVTQPDCKSGALFPAKLRGRFARLEKPTEGGTIWLAYSEDLVYWGGREVVLTPRAGYWDDDHVGPAAPPIEVAEGWLCIYYGVKVTASGPLYRLGAALLDRENPSVVRGRTDTPILAPRETYERIGDLPNIIYSCGAILEPNNVIRLYYGGSDSCICLATARLQNIVAACLEAGSEG